MKSIKRISALVMIFALLLTQTAFADITMISLEENAIVNDDSFYVSIKIIDAASAKITVYEEQTYHIGLIEKELKISGGTLSDAQGNPVKTIKYKVQGEIYEKYTDVDNLQSADLELLREGKTKDDKGKSVKLSNGKELSYFGTAVYRETVRYEMKEGVGLYTKLFTGFTPGIYKIVVDAQNEAGKTVESAAYYVLVKAPTGEEKTEENAEKNPTHQTVDDVEEPEEKPQGLLGKISAFLKSLFK